MKIVGPLNSILEKLEKQNEILEKRLENIENAILTLVEITNSRGKLIDKSKSTINKIHNMFSFLQPVEEKELPTIEEGNPFEE